MFRAAMRGSTALLSVAGGALVVSFSPVFVALAHVGPTISAFYRMAIGSAILLALAFARGSRGVPTGNYRALLIATGLFLALDLAIWHRAILLVGPGLAAIFGNLQVFFLTGFGLIVLHEHIRRTQVIGILSAVAGLIMIFGGGSAGATRASRLGVLLGLCTAASYAGFLLTLRHARKAHPSRSASEVTAWFSVVAAVALGVVGIVEGETFTIPDRSTLGALVGLGVGSQVVGWVLITRGLPHIQAARAGLLLLLQPALAFVWDILFFHRPTRPIELVGAVVTLSGIYLGSLGASRSS